MKDFLLEIGTEEIPARFVKGGIESLRSAFTKFFKEEHVTHGNIRMGGQIRHGRMKGETLLLFGMQLNLNEAGIDDLMALPGIGAKTADAIVKFREEKGPFKIKSELMNVRGIGRKKFKNIKEKLTI